MNTNSNALIPTYLVEKFSNTKTSQIIATLSGVVLITCLAQVSIPLPFTPVPITGQTFGVFFMALLWGRKLGTITVLLYLLLGFSGLPIFATAKLGPTIGYLFGMVGATIVIGKLSDTGFTNKSFTKSFLACMIGSLIVFAIGILNLGFYTGWANVLKMGVLPFIPGMLIKNSALALISSKITK